MKPRMTNPVLSIPGVLESLQALSNVATDAGARAGLSQNIRNLVSLRASQINGCAVCLDMHARALKKSGETDERLAALVVAIAAINTWNRLNVTTAQIAGEWTAQWVA